MRPQSISTDSQVVNPADPSQMIPSTVQPCQYQRIPNPSINHIPIQACVNYFHPRQQPPIQHMASAIPTPGTNMNSVPPMAAQPISGVFTPSPASVGFKRLLAEMKSRQFDSIRFAAYRTASKLRYIQQRTLFGYMDLWRVVETFREFGLHQISDQNATLDYNSTGRILSHIYSQMTVPVSTTTTSTEANSKATRLLDPAVANMAVEMLLGWLIYALDVCATGRITVTSLKIALSTLTNAKPADKLRYHFTLLSDPSGALIPSKFEAYLQDLLKLPISVFEGPNFCYSVQAAQALFTGRSKNILLEEFLERMLADPGPQILVWLTIFHRLASVENVLHSVRCEGCKREPICGLRYKCTRCPHYNLCQDCFWTGVTTEQHTNAHDVKEYSSSTKSHSRQFGHSLRKSFQFSRLTGSTTQAHSISSGTTTQGLSEWKRSNGTTVYKRPPLGSVFEWNSAPGAMEVNGFGNNGVMVSPQTTTPSVDPRTTLSAVSAMGPFPVGFRPQAPVNALRSPLPHRRHRQLNPLFLSTPANPAMHTFVDNKLLLSQQPNFFHGYPTPGMYLGERPIPPNTINGAGSNMMFPSPSVQFVSSSAEGDQARLRMISDSRLGMSGVVGQPLPQPTIPTGIQMFRQNGERMLFTTPSDLYSVRPQTMSLPLTSAPVDGRQAISQIMCNSTLSAGRNIDQKCREEHQLIARYAAQLAAASAFKSDFRIGDVADSPHTQKQLIAELQAKNRKILKEIERLRVEQQKQAAVIAAAGVNKLDPVKEQDMDNNLSPSSLVQAGHSGDMQSSMAGSQSGVGGGEKLVTELQALRQRKDELETRMNNLQRNRTDLMIQLETLVRLLSVTTGPAGNTPPRHLSLSANSSNQECPNNSLLPCTPLGNKRFGHQSRYGSKPPEYPPRRSSSLCHTSGDRMYRDGRLLSPMPPEKRQFQHLTDTSNGLTKFGDKSLATADILQKNLLSPVGDFGGDTSGALFRTGVSHTAFGNEKPTDPSLATSNFLEKYERILKKGDTTSSSNNKFTNSSAAPRRQYGLLSPTRSRINSYGRDSTDQTTFDRLRATSYTDSGSDSYMYSDPEVGGLGVTISENRHLFHHSMKQRSRLDPTDLTDLGSDKTNGIRSSNFTDNYEYAGALQPESDPSESRPSNTVPSEVLTSTKQ